jgi:hypothetical protein
MYKNKRCSRVSRGKSVYNWVGGGIVEQAQQGNNNMYKSRGLCSRRGEICVGGEEQCCLVAFCGLLCSV